MKLGTCHKAPGNFKRAALLRLYQARSGQQASEGRRAGKDQRVACSGQERLWKANYMNNKKQWILALSFVLLLSVGAAVVRSLDMAFAKYFSPGGLDVYESSLITMLEMGLIPLFGLFGIAIPLGMKMSELVQLSWKVFLIGAIFGLIAGSTYAQGCQNIFCGFIF